MPKKVLPFQTSEQLKERIRAYHRGDARLPPEWAVMTEVGQGTGSNAGRYADAIAMNLWPSRQLAIHGYEVKASRGDWLRELNHPEKAEPIAAYCDYWWIVANDGVVKDDLPDGWGLLIPNAGERLRVVTRATKRTFVRDTDRTFVAAMLRRAVQQAPDVLAMEGAVRTERDRLTALHRETSAAIVNDRTRAEHVISMINAGARTALTEHGHTFNLIGVYSSDETLLEVGRAAALGQNTTLHVRHADQVFRSTRDSALALAAAADAGLLALTEEAVVG